MRFTFLLVATLVVLLCIPEGESGWVAKKKGKAVEKFKSMVKRIKEAIGHLKHDIKKFFKSAKEGIKSAVAKIKAEVEATGDSALKVTFKQIYKGLDKARDKIGEMAELADKKFYGVMEKAHEMFFTVTSQIEKFHEKQKKALESKKDSEKGIALLEEFVEKSSEEVGSCSDATLNPIKSIYEYVKGIIKGGIDKLETIVRECEKCLEKGLKTDTFMCIRNLASVVGDQLYKLGEEIMKLKDKLIGGAIKELLNVACIGKTRASVELSKLKIEKEIKNLK